MQRDEGLGQEAVSLVALKAQRKEKYEHRACFGGNRETWKASRRRKRGWHRQEKMTRKGKPQSGPEGWLPTKRTKARRMRELEGMEECGRDGSPSTWRIKKGCERWKEIWSFGGSNRNDI